MPENTLNERSPAWSALMVRAQGGDAAAYRQLLTEISPFIKRFLQSRLFSGHAVEDLTQEVLLALHAARHTYRPEQPFVNWLFGIARHKAMDHLRSHYRKNENEIADEALVTFRPDPANRQEEALLGMDLQAALARLPEKQRRLLQMVEVEGYSMAEAAAKTGMTAGAAKVAVHRALRKLREIMVSDGYA